VIFLDLIAGPIYATTAALDVARHMVLELTATSLLSSTSAAPTAGTQNA
jgi:hypothetical protein